IAAALAGGVYFAGRSGTDPEAYSNDFNVYYFAAREVLAGRDPYQRSLGEWTPYLYPPFLVEALIPLALLPLPVAAYLWFLLSALSVMAAAWMSARLAGDASSDYRRMRVVICTTIAVIVIGRFALDTFAYGQVNNLLAALAVAHVYFYMKGKRFASAVFLALAVSIKLTPAVLIFYHLARRRWGFAGKCVLAIIVVTLLSFLPFGGSAPDVFTAFVSRTVENQQGFNLAYHGNQSLRGAVARLQNEPDEPARTPTDTVTLIASLAILALAMVAAAFARSEAAAAAPLFCCSVLLSPLSWKAHFVMLILPVAYLVFEVWRAKLPLKWPLVCALAGAFALFTLTSPKVIGLAAAEWSDAHSLIFVGALLIYFPVIACVILQRRSQCVAGDESK
ncbi:MAG TPA: glycosyltransferase family 87 protein, partial [Blastocatellia bacterium]|nr:glycosyltransferase family 87 protein [Blastocatellia bacterium]